MATKLVNIQNRLSNAIDIEMSSRSVFLKALAERVTPLTKDILSISTGDGIWDYLTLKEYPNLNSITATDIVKCPVAPKDVSLLKSMGNWYFKQVVPDTTLPFKNNSFDAVYHMDVIEHTDMPYLFLQEQYRVLKKGGFILLGTPNLLRPLNLIRLLSGKLNFPNKIGYKEEIGDYIHVQEFTSWQLKTLLSEIGFKDINFYYCFFGIHGIKLLDYSTKESLGNLCHFLLVSAYKR